MPRVLFILQNLSSLLVSDDEIRHCLVAAENSPAAVPGDCEIRRVQADDVKSRHSETCDLVLLDYRFAPDDGTGEAVRRLPAGVPVILLVPESIRVVDDGAIDCLEYEVVARSTDLRQNLTQAVNRAAQRQVLRKIHRELTRARQVQSAMLPSTTPQIPGFDLAFRSIPASLVGGDFFAFSRRGEFIHDILIGDVTGHGFNAAIRMAETQAYFRAFMAADDERTPSDVLESVNTLMSDTSSGIPLLASAMIVRIDAERRTVSWAGAGHQGHVLRSSGDTMLMPASGPLLGCYPTAQFSMSDEFDLRECDKIVLVTDGISETCGDQSGTLFGTDRMLDELSQCSTKSSEDSLKSLLLSVREFRGFAVPRDDITAVLIRVESPAA